MTIPFFKSFLGRNYLPHHLWNTSPKQITYVNVTVIMSWNLFGVCVHVTCSIIVSYIEKVAN